MNKINVYEDIRRQIVQEKLLPGQWLIERELCETYSMSRTPIREILWKLTADGFLEQEANRGFVVRRLGLEQILEIFQAREAIEGMAARLACRKGGEAFRSTLREIKKKNRQDQYRIRPGGWASHWAASFTGPSWTPRTTASWADIHERLENMTVLTANITKRSPAIEKASAEAHLNIINAMLQQDEEKAEQLMREHLRETCRHVVEQFYPGMIANTSNSR